MGASGSVLHLCSGSNNGSAVHLLLLATPYQKARVYAVVHHVTPQI